MIALLQPILVASKEAESDNACVSDVIPLSKKIRLQLEGLNEDNIAGVRAMKESMVHQMDRLAKSFNFHYVFFQ